MTVRCKNRTINRPEKPNLKNRGGGTKPRQKTSSATKSPSAEPADGASLPAPTEGLYEDAPSASVKAVRAKRTSAGPPPGCHPRQAANRCKQRYHVKLLAKTLDKADPLATSAHLHTGNTSDRRRRGPSFYSGFHGGAHSAKLAWLALNMKYRGGFDINQRARLLAYESSGIVSGADMDTLDPLTVPAHDVYNGGAPCQDFSKAGRRRGRRSRRGRLYERQWKMIARWLYKPKVVLLEQVPDVLEVDGGAAQLACERAGRAQGYTPQRFVLDSARFGSASSRTRLFTVFIRNDIRREMGALPPPSEHPGPLRRVRDVVIPLVLRPEEHKLRRSGWRDIAPRVEPGYTGAVLIGARDGPALGNRMYDLNYRAITQRASGHNPTGVYMQDGTPITLTPRESARCMDIDDSVDIGERWGPEQAQEFVGNAMSVFTMRALGESIKAYLLDWSERTGEPLDGDTDVVNSAPTSHQRPAPSVRPSHVKNDRATQTRSVPRCRPCGPTTTSDENYTPLRRHDDDCPIWCTRLKCAVCDVFPRRPARLLVQYAWLRQERKKWGAIAELYQRERPEVDQRRLRTAFLTTLAAWRRRIHEPEAPLAMVWWRWPLESQDDMRLGVKMGFLSKPMRYHRPNHPTGEHADVLSEFERFESCGFVESGKGIVVTNPLAYVPKKTAGIGRVIVDMKRGQVNAHLTANYPVVYPRIEDVGRRLYPGAWLFETDFKDMFYHFPVHPDDRPYLGVRKPFDSGYVRFKRLPMGAATSPYHCSRLTYIWQDELHRRAPYAGKWSVNLPGVDGYDPGLPMLSRRDTRDGSPAADDFLYVDDALGIAPTRERAVQALRTLVVHGGSYGFVMKYKKIKDPAQSQRSFNGFDIETRPEYGGPMIQLREEVRDATLSLVDALLAERSSMQRDGISRRRLAQVVGKLQSLCPAVPHGTTFLRRLYDSVHCLHLPPEQRPGTDYECAVWLDKEHWKDVQWWSTALREHSGYRLLTNRDVHTRIHFTDGSGTGTGGCAHDFRGALPEVSFFSGLWDKAAASMTSNWKELRSILIALRRERTEAARQGRESPLRQCRIYHATDNMVSESILARGTSTAPPLQQLMREIAYELMVQQCALIPVHVAGKRLIAQGTDGLSRGQTAVGTMSGDTDDVQAYNPLGGGLPDLPPALRRWCRARYGEQPHLREPDDWTADNVKGNDTLFYPHPLLARDALMSFRRHRMLAPSTTAATFLLPRRLHSQWQRQLRGFSVTVIPAGAGAHWPATEFEALVVARAERWTPRLPSPPHRPSQVGRRLGRGTSPRGPRAQSGRATRFRRR